MDEKSISGLLSQLISNTDKKDSAADKVSAGGENNFLVETLKTAAGMAGGGIEPAVNEFLNGQGELHETTRTAVIRGSSTAASDVAKLLTSRFNLAPAIANLIAPLLVKLLPSISQAYGGETAAKPKARRKARPKTSSSAKTEASTSKKKPKKKTSPRPKTSAAKPAAKKKPSPKARKSAD